MVKTKKKAKASKSKKVKPAVDREDQNQKRQADAVMQTVLAESKVEEETVRLDQWVSIECPHCGEGSDLHVTTEMDGQSIDQDCAVCCRPYVAHVEIEDDEANVAVEAA